MTQQTSEAVHLYSPNPRPLLFLPYYCFTTIHKNRHQQWFAQDPGTLKLQTPSINQLPNINCNPPPSRHLPTILTHLYQIHPKPMKNTLQYTQIYIRNVSFLYEINPGRVWVGGNAREEKERDREGGSSCTLSLVSAECVNPLPTCANSRKIPFTHKEQ